MTKSNKNRTGVNTNHQETLRDGVYYTGNKGPAFGVRFVQVGIMAIGLGISISYKITFSIAIIAMTDSSTPSNADVPTYNWNNKSIILSAIFWTSICLPLVSGYLGKQYEPKWFIFGAGVLGSITFLLIPVVAKYGGSTGVIICRLIEGLARGMLIPMNTCILGKWVPVEERSKMGFMGSAAITLSIIITSISTGFISESYLGWPWIFYIFGTIGLVWCTLFGFLAKQSPENHPRITPEEKNYIQVSLDQQGNEIPSTPWKKIFTSIHVWAIFAAQISTCWNVIILSTEMSIFLTKVMKYGVKNEYGQTY